MTSKAKGYDCIYLSPHLDDVVLSCGGTLYTQTQAGARVLVVSFFAGTPPDDSITAFTRELKARWGGAEDPVAVRRCEDLSALQRLGAEGLHLPFLDCVYRQDVHTGEAYYPTVEHIFAEVHPAEASFHQTLRAVFEAALPDLASATLYAPLTVGHHVDHILVQRLAFQLLQEGETVLFYEDYPYAGDTEAINRVLAQWPDACWHSQVVPFGEEVLVAKGDAVACYASQISTFWADDQAMRQALYAQARAVGGEDSGLPYGERTWQIVPPCPPLVS